jgi:cytochrome c
MDSFQLNKLAGAFLGTVFILMSIGIISDSLFDSPAPEKPGFLIEAAEAAAPAEGAAGAEPAKAELISPLLAAADPAAGEKIFKKCAACHTGDKGGANKVGPNLWGIVGRPAAAHEGFSYSAGMKEFAAGGAWDYEKLASFITAPKAYVKGTAMGFAGLKKPDERANLIAYLRTLSDSPAALP